MKLAIVLFNLGGPDGPAAVRPFLNNLFKDPAIIGAPSLIRLPLAWWISSRREKAAQANYNLMGGRSPLLPETQAQAAALEAEVKRQAPDVEARCFISMRYWKPFAAEAAKQVAAFSPDEIVLLPLYPQYSTTTSASSLRDWARTYKGPGRVRTICCYPTLEGFVEANAEAIRQAWEAGGSPSNLRLLFSAHGLPQKVVDAGDPYEDQVRATAAAIAARLPQFPDWRVSFQSRVGPLKWLEPATDDEVRRAGAEGKGLLVCPLAFVSEHVETLVELDHEYAHLAAEVGCAPYLRARTAGVREAFISGMAEAALVSLSRTYGTRSAGGWMCGPEFRKCACRSGEGADGEFQLSQMPQ
jgi:ferrochelatase